MATNFYKKIWFILFILGFITLSFILCYNISTIDNLYLLPLAYSFSMVLVKKYYNQNITLAVIIIEIVKMCRYLLLPIMAALENKFEGVNIAPQYNNIAVILMAYELISISFIMFFTKSNSIHKKIDSPFKFTPLCYIFILLGLYIIFTEPFLKARLFKFHITISEELGLYRESRESLSGFSRVFFLIGVITIYTFIQIQINKIKKIKHYKLFLHLIVCILFISCMWTNERGSVSRWNMIIAVLLSMYTLLYYYPNKKNNIIFGGILGGMLVIIMGSLLKTLSFGLNDYTISDSTQMYFSSQYFDEYFEGIRSVSNCIKVSSIYNSDNLFTGIITDWFYNFPFLMKLLGISNTAVATTYYHNVSGQYDLIMPTISMCHLRVGELFSPLYSCISTFIALKFSAKLNSESNLLIKFFYIYIVFWFSLFMAISPNIIDANIWAPFIAIWILSFEKKL